MKAFGLTAIAMFVFFLSCKEQDTISFSADDNANLQSESSIDAQLEDVSDMSGVAMSADAGTLTGGRKGESGSRVIPIGNDTRFTCATVTLEFADDNDPSVPSMIHGYITIDFGTGCVGPNGRERKGKIKIEFMGRRFLFGSMVTITTDGYSVDGILVEGTRTEVNATESTDAPMFTINEEVAITFLDGSTASRTATRNRASNPLQDSWTITGSAFGTSRRGVDYVMTITKALVFKRACAISSKMVMPVEGTKELVTDAKKITMDFGDGSCDTIVTVTVNGRSKDISVSPNGD